MRSFIVPLASAAIGLGLIYAGINFGDTLRDGNWALVTGATITGAGCGYLLKAARNLRIADSRK